MVMDIKCAFLYGKTPRDIYIELPDEDPMSINKDYVGKLLKAMYGTRDAPAVWQEEIRALVTNMNFTQSRINPCVYYNRERDLRVNVHVDDVLVTGMEEDLIWFRESLKKVWELKATILGGHDNPVGESVFLGRTIRLTEKGYRDRGGR